MARARGIGYGGKTKNEEESENRRIINLSPILSYRPIFGFPPNEPLPCFQGETRNFRPHSSVRALGEPVVIT